MKVVILAHENDNHTTPLKWGLEQAGYQVVCWGGLAWNEKQRASASFDEIDRLWLGAHPVDRGDVVWIRRPQPAVHNPNVTEPDRKFAEGEYRWFSLSLMYLLETLPFRCVNKYTASRFINNKSVQLVLARQCGMRVPATMMSNQPGAVRKFLEEYPGRTICKPFFPHVWQKSDGGLAATETFELTADQLPADEILTWAPAIYQEMVVKEYDVRMVLMGNKVYSYALHNPKKALDWRQDAGQGLVEVEIIKTPPAVEKGVLEFARRSGVCFGSLDFAIDNKGEWWFLEINEQGQFLWLDDFNSKVNMMQKFLAFITEPSNSTRAPEEREHLFPSLAAYRESGFQATVEPEVNVGVNFISTE